MKAKPLVVIFLTVFIDLVGFGMIIPLSPFLAREYGADALTVGLLMSIYSFMQFLLAPFWGSLSDRIGRRPVILLSLFGAGSAHLLFGFGQSLLVLFIARAFAGLFGANIASAMAYIADVTKDEDRAKGMGLVGAAFGLGFILGPALGGVAGHIGVSLGDQAPFGESFAAIVASFICFANFALAYFVLPETNQHIVGSKSKQAKKNRLKHLFSFATRRTLGPLLVAYFLSTLALANVEAPMFLFVEDIFQWTQIQASFGFAYIGVIMVFTQGYLIRKLIPKVGERKSAVLGTFFYALGFLGMALSGSVFEFAVAVTFLGLGSGITNPSLTGSISLLAGDDEQGAVLGVNQSLAALGRIIGPAMGGWLYREFAPNSSFFSGTGLSVLAMVIVLMIFSQLPEAGLKKSAAKQG